VPSGLLSWRAKMLKHKTAIFREINVDKIAGHHDAFDFRMARWCFLHPCARASELGCCSCGGAENHERICPPAAVTACGLTDHKGVSRVAAPHRATAIKIL